MLWGLCPNLWEVGILYSRLNVPKHWLWLFNQNYILLKLKISSPCAVQRHPPILSPKEEGYIRQHFGHRKMCQFPSLLWKKEKSSTQPAYPYWQGKGFSRRWCWSFHSFGQTPWKQGLQLGSFSFSSDYFNSPTNTLLKGWFSLN